MVQKFGNSCLRNLSSVYNVANFWQQKKATEVVEIPQKMETTSKSIGFSKYKAQAGRQTKLGAFIFWPLATGF
jgi:hypothetical protein